VVADVLEVERHQVRTAEGGGEAHEQQRLVSGTSQVLVAGQASSTLSSSGSMSGAACSGGLLGRGALGTADAFPYGDDPGNLGRAGPAPEPEGEPHAVPGCAIVPIGPGVDDRGGGSLSRPACRRRGGTHEADDIYGDWEGDTW
jgi:hypothetical protein